MMPVNPPRALLGRHAGRGWRRLREVRALTGGDVAFSLGEAPHHPGQQERVGDDHQGDQAGQRRGDGAPGFDAVGGRGHPQDDGFDGLARRRQLLRRARLAAFDGGREAVDVEVCDHPVVAGRRRRLAGQPVLTVGVEDADERKQVDDAEPTLDVEPVKADEAGSDQHQEGDADRQFLVPAAALDPLGKDHGDQREDDEAQPVQPVRQDKVEGRHRRGSRDGTDAGLRERPRRRPRTLESVRKVYE